jgi:hypothetical protein
VIEAKYPGAIERARVRVKKERFEKKFIGSVPEWAKRYVAKHAAGSVSSLQIRQSRTKDYSSGRCWYGSGRLVVTFSRPDSINGLVERQATVLHEIAHALAPWGGHDDRFYDQWYRLLRDEGIYRSAMATGRFVGASSLKAAAKRQRAK